MIKIKGSGGVTIQVDSLSSVLSTCGTNDGNYCINFASFSGPGKGEHLVSVVLSKKDFEVLREGIETAERELESLGRHKE